MDFSVLKQRQSLPLEAKVTMARKRIREWLEHWDHDVFVSYSGGKDSTVLLKLVREVEADVPAVFVDTGLEFPEIKSFVNATPNAITIRPRKTFREVIEQHGYPVISKDIAKKLKHLQNPTDRNLKIRTVILTGKTPEGEERSKANLLPDRYRYLIDAPFKISDYCCDVLKKQPLAQYEKESGRRPYVGTMASDSRKRTHAYLMNGGCNAYSTTHPQSNPLGIWNEQDVLEYLHETRTPVASVYGNLERTEDGLQFTGEQRTGCVFCLFGIFMEKENRFVRLERTHPKLHAYCMESLKMRDVLSFLKVPFNASAE
jgi:3'-phosphoadenosine 5'-phosphosulfate sulfotransferase (PAPS reductase)/FAD synthetase